MIKLKIATSQSAYSLLQVSKWFQISDNSNIRNEPLWDTEISASEVLKKYWSLHYNQMWRFIVQQILNLTSPSRNTIHSFNINNKSNTKNNSRGYCW